MGYPKVVVAAALGECVHVAGVMNFLRLAEQAGWHTVFLGPAVPVERVVQAAREHGASLVGVSYRLTPDTGERLLAEFAEAADELRSAGVRFAFGGTPPVAERARRFAGFFDALFDGGQPPEEVSCLSARRPGDPLSGHLSADAGRAHRLEDALSIVAPPLRVAHSRSEYRGRRAHRRGADTGRDLARHRPGCPGKLLSPGTPGPPTDRGRGAYRCAAPTTIGHSMPPRVPATIH